MIKNYKYIIIVINYKLLPKKLIELFSLYHIIK